jgi:hypothetical protein
MIPLVLAFIIFSVSGALFTFAPGRVRDFIVDACVRGRWGFWIGREIILRRVRKASYLFELRLIGFGCILGAVACFWIIFAEKKVLP